MINKSPLILLNEQEVTAHIGSFTDLIDNILIFKKTDSTNNYFKNKNLVQQKPFALCLAEQQTAGRGRLDRTWFSPFGTNIYLTISWQTAKLLSTLSNLSLHIGIAFMKMLESLDLANDIGIKWPNDIYYQQQKLAGILIETQPVSPSFNRVIIGIGINVNMAEYAANSIGNAWTSLQHITHQVHNRNIIAGTLVKKIIERLMMIEHFSERLMLAEWNRYDILSGRELTLIRQGTEITGIAKGINSEGHLQIQTADNQLLICNSAETSVKNF